MSDDLRKPDLQAALPPAPETADADGAEESEEAFVLREMAAMRAEQEQLRLGASGLPAGFHGTPWGALDADAERLPASIALRKWANMGGRIFLFGPVGTGKTLFAATAARTYLEKRMLRWTSATDLMHGLSSDFGSPERTRALQLVEQHCALVIDDLGTERVSDTAIQTFKSLLDRQLNEHLATIVTSNFTVPELGAIYGDPVASRLATFDQYQLGGRDRRLDPERT